MNILDFIFTGCFGGAPSLPPMPPPPPPLPDVSKQEEENKWQRGLKKQNRKSAVEGH